MNKNVNKYLWLEWFQLVEKNCEIAALMNQTFENATLKKTETWDFPGSPVVKTLPFQCNGHGFDPWSED